MTKNKSKHGGKRKNAGRKKKEPTKDYPCTLVEGCCCTRNYW